MYAIRSYYAGYTREELIGTTSLDRATEEFREFMLQNQETLLNQEYREFEGEGYSKDGRRIPFLVHGNTLRNDRGEIIGHMAFVTDMTEHKKALRLAGEVQKSLLPQEKPEVRGLDIAGRNVSCDEIRITSYNVCYTKLLRVALSGRQMFFGPAAVPARAE